MKRCGAFSLVELLVVMAIIGILSALLLPSLSRSLRRAEQVQCLNNLRQVGISMQQFADDHRNRYPMQVPAADGGALEATEGSAERVGIFVNAVENFVAVERELVTPKLLVCQADQRTAAEDFAHLRPDQVSYLLSSNALPGSSSSVLAVDRNLELAAGAPGAPPTNTTLTFGAAMHERRGNVLMSDGRVEWLGGLSLPVMASPSTGLEGPNTAPTPREPDGTKPPPSAPVRPADDTNAPSLAAAPQLAISANRTPRMNRPPLMGSASPAETLTNAPPPIAPEVSVPAPAAAPMAIAYIPLAPMEDPVRSRWWWWLLALAVALAWWYLRRHADVEPEPAVRGAPAGMRLQNTVAAAGTLAQAAGVKKFFTGAAINADLLLTMLEKHGIHARQEFARGVLREHEDEFSRETVVFVPEEDYDRAYQLFYAERQDEL